LTEQFINNAKLYLNNNNDRTFVIEYSFINSKVIDSYIDEYSNIDIDYEAGYNSYEY